MSEIWKDIPGYEGRYQASTEGRIRGCDRTYHVEPKNGRAAFDRVHKGKILHPCIGSNGYYYVGLRKTRRSKSADYLPIHHLMAWTFLGERPKDAEICHGDGNKLNNRLNNLRYGSPRDNRLDVYRCGGKYGKLTPEQAREVKARLASGDQQSQIARDFGVTQSAIHYIAKGVRFSWLST